MVARPSVPAPMTTPRARRRRGGCGVKSDRDGAGHRLIMTAASSLQAAGTSCSWQAWATSAGTSRRRCPRRSRSAGPAAGGRRPAVHNGWCGPSGTPTGRLDAAIRQCNTGSTTTRRPSSASPTTSWPGTKGKLTMGSNHRECAPPGWPGRCRRSPTAAAGPPASPAPTTRAGRCRRAGADQRPPCPAATRRHPGGGKTPPIGRSRGPSCPLPGPDR